VIVFQAPWKLTYSLSYVITYFKSNFNATGRRFVNLQQLCRKGSVVFTTQFTLSSCVCVSVCLSGIVSNVLDEWSWFSAWMLPSIYHTPCYREIQVSPKRIVLPSQTLSETLDMRNFATANRSCYQLSSSSLLTTLATVAAPWLDSR